MEAKKLGQEHAFMHLHFNGKTSYEYNGGMSKRFYAACAAMQGYIAGVRGSGDSVHIEELIESSFRAADELLKQENQ